MTKEINQANSVEQRLSNREDQLRLVTDALPVVISYLDNERRYQFNNAAYEKQFGISRESTINKHIADVIGISAYERTRQHIDTALTGQETHFEFIDETHGDECNIYEVSCLPHIDSDDKVVGFFILSNDITFRKQSEQKTFEEKERAEVTLKSIGDAVITTDANGMIEFMNPTAEKMTGWSLDAVKGQVLQHVFNLHDETTMKPVSNPVQQCLEQRKIISLAGQVILKSRDGKEFSIQESAAPIHDRKGDITGVVLVFKDVTGSRRMRMVREISCHASHDALTGLVNRRELENLLERVLETIIEDGNSHVFCYLDLDQFKVINDTCSHMAGDELLRQLSFMLLDITRKSDTVARLGGDEFAVLMKYCTLEQAEKVANTIRKNIHTYKFRWDGKFFNIGASIGLVAITPESKSVADILSTADAACYSAKSQGRNRVSIYDINNDDVVNKHYGEMQWVSRINDSLREGHFLLYSQAIKPVDPDKNYPLMHELLIRMKDGEKIMPAQEFLPAAEQYNLSTQIDRWVIDSTKEWFNQYPEYVNHPSCLFTINLSGHSLGNADFLSYVINQLEDGCIRPGTLCFEITETAAIANMNSAVKFMNRLKELGCKLALDDFGSGFSTFAYLKTLPIDFLKIDGMFVKDIVNDQIAYSMVKSINEIGQIMGMRTIAEWVENQEILDKLKEIGVDYAQGYVISHPQSIDVMDHPYLQHH